MPLVWPVAHLVVAILLGWVARWPARCHALVMNETSTVQFGNTEIDYAIVRCSRKTVGVAVSPSGAVVISAPNAVEVARLDRVVLAKAAWIVGKLRQRAALAPAPEHEFVSGETFRYLGRQYRLRVVRSEQVQPVAVDGNFIVVHVPTNTTAANSAACVRTALIAFYTRAAREIVASAVNAWAVKAGAAMPKVLVTNQAKRWGSCSKGVIRINWRLMQAPKALIDYVLAHEVTHLAHDHHDAAFWSALGRIMPDYEARKAQLNTLGPELTW